MAWAKLDNPKPTAMNVAADGFKITARNAPHGGKGGNADVPKRYINIKLGKLLCERASFLNKEHRVHVMKGDNEDDGKIAVALDDTNGKFVAKRRADGRYEINITASAAAGRFSTVFPPFSGVGCLVKIPGTSPVITLVATNEFLAA